jgi:hypothetical protein
MKLWKALGVAGLAGVATTGAIIARNQRARAQLTPEQVRDRLRQRLEEAQRNDQPDSGNEAGFGQDSTESSARA